MCHIHHEALPATDAVFGLLGGGGGEGGGHAGVVGRRDDHLPLGERVGVLPGGEAAPAAADAAAAVARADGAAGGVVVVVVLPHAEEAEGEADGDHGGEDDGDGEEGDVVGLDAHLHLEAAVLGRLHHRADGDDVALLPQAQLEQVGVPGRQAVHRVRVHLQAHVDVLVLRKAQLNELGLPITR